MLAAAGLFYARVRPDPRLASGCLSTAQVIAFAAVAAPLSYLAAAADLPLNDRAYDAIDRALGLDWKAMLDVMNAWPLLFDALRPIYLSLTLQMTSRRSLPRIYRQIRLAVGLYARLHLRGAHHDRDVGGAAGGRGVALLRIDRGGLAARASDREHELAGVLRPA